MKTKWENKLIERKRDTYMKVFDEMEFKNDKEGMSKTEYDAFLKALPATYRKSLYRADTFNKLAGQDGIVDFEEFKGLLDKIEINLKEIPEYDDDEEEEEENEQDAQDNNKDDTNADDQRDAKNNTNNDQAPPNTAPKAQEDVDEPQENSPLLETENNDKPQDNKEDT